MSRKANIFGILVDKVDLPQTRALIDRFVADRTPHQIVTVNLDFIHRALHEEAFRDLINTSSLAVADGMPVLWTARLLKDALPWRITGTDIVLASCEIARERSEGVFLLGAEPGVAAGAADVLSQRFPGLKIAGTYSPPFGEFRNEENSRIVDMINSARPSCLFVAFGCPKQDFWIRRHLSQLDVAVAVGVGGVFNYLTGRVKRAPAWVQNAGFEWLVRTVQQPHLAKRYFVYDLPVLGQALGYRLSLCPHPAGTKARMATNTVKNITARPANAGGGG